MWYCMQWTVNLILTDLKKKKKKTNFAMLIKKLRKSHSLFILVLVGLCTGRQLFDIEADWTAYDAGGVESDFW